MKARTIESSIYLRQNNPRIKEVERLEGEAGWPQKSKGCKENEVLPLGCQLWNSTLKLKGWKASLGWPQKLKGCKENEVLPSGFQLWNSILKLKGWKASQNSVGRFLTYSSPGWPQELNRCKVLEILASIFTIFCECS